MKDGSVFKRQFSDKLLSVVNLCKTQIITVRDEIAEIFTFQWWRFKTTDVRENNNTNGHG